MTAQNLPLVYACPGCLAFSHLAGHLAARLGQRRLAVVSDDMGVLQSGAAGGVPIVAIDGCSQACAWDALGRYGVPPSAYHVLTELGARPGARPHIDGDLATRLFDYIVDCLPGRPSAAALG